MDEKEIEELLEKTKKREEEDLAKKLADMLQLKYFNLKIHPVDPEALAIIPEQTAKNLKIVGIEKAGKKLIIGALNPLKPELKEYINNLKNQGYEIEIGIVSYSSLEKAWQEYRFIKPRKVKYTEILVLDEEKLNKIMNELTTKEDLKKYLVELEKENPLEILDYIMAGALKFETSDVHLEPTEKNITVKLRIDGILYEVASFNRAIYSLLKNRIKLFAGLFLNITEKPQDGRFSISFGKKNIEIRVSTIPSSYDETIVMRILDVEKIMIPLEKLGLEEYDLEVINYYIHQPNGLILNTGPTGSGKTTTLYAVLNKIKRPEIKIITIEDPIEYKLEGITQTQVNPAENYTFATGLRSILRQDPDVILVGEIRDKETAEIAIHASLTGHLVLSTLHTNDSLGAIPRLIDLGVDKTLIPPALRLVIAQRLLRRVCEYCKEEYIPDENFKELIIKKLETIPENVKQQLNLKEIRLVRSKGCEKCFYTGYKGRVAIFELLKITQRLQDLIYEEVNEKIILEAAIKDGFINLQQAGLIKALKKTTTIDEVERVTGTLT
jgi:type IV pilus assembly protein PilB